MENFPLCLSLLEFLHFSCVASKGHMKHSCIKLLGKDSGFAGLDYG